RVDRGRDRHLPARGDHERVPIGGLALDVFDRDAAARAGLVLHDHGLANVFRQLLSDKSREKIVAAAGRQADDQIDWPVWRIRRVPPRTPQRPPVRRGPPPPPPPSAWYV